MKKGFTLVEILAVIALLSIVIALAVPSVTKIRRSALEREANSQKAEIEAAGVLYSYDNYFSNCYVKVVTLISEDYLKPDENGDIINPLTKESLKEYAVMINDSGNLKNTGTLMKLEDLVESSSISLKSGINIVPMSAVASDEIIECNVNLEDIENNTYK